MLSAKNGFSLIEILISMAILVILSSASLTWFFNYQQETDLNYNSKIVANALRDAQSRSASGKDFKRWGVYFDDINNKFTLFEENNYGDGYATAIVKEETYLSPSAKINTISLNGGGKEIIFNKNNGDTDQYGTYGSGNIALIIENSGSGTKRNIIITPIGRIDSL